MLYTIRVNFLTFFILFIGINFVNAQGEETYYKRFKYIPGYGIKKMKNPEIFQGNRKRKKYFEGWYFKMVSQDGTGILSVIPGVSISKNGEEHAFIQVIDGKTAETYYYSFPIEEFQFSKERLAIRIGENYFSEDSVILNLQDENNSFKGEVFMSNQTELVLKKNRKKGIMGWYRFVPFMQCYHGVVSLNHDLYGSIVSGQESYNFDKGLGYIEKDWGKSMPSAWIWMQSNNFNTENTSFMLSVANVPWIGRSFTGFLGFFLHNNKMVRFGTYSRAKLKLEVTNSDTVNITITDKKFSYQIQAYRNNSGELKAPVKGSMDRRISESIDAKLQLTVFDKESKIIFQDSTRIAGLEMVGDMEELSKVK